METRNYETVFITNPHAAEAKMAEINTRNQQIVENYGGKVYQLDDWGKKKMAYPIRKESKGHYYCLTYKANNQCVAEIERGLRINEEVFRFLTVKLDEKVDPLQAIEAYKRKLEAHAKREKEKAERDAERHAERGGGGFRGGRGGGHREEYSAPPAAEPARVEAMTEETPEPAEAADEE